MLQQVSVDNGFTKIGSPTTLIVNDPADGPYVEAPSLTKMPDGTYVLYYSSNCYTTPLYDVSYATLRNIKGPYKKFGGLLQTGTYGLTAPGGLDLAVNGDHAVFHANWNGARAMRHGWRADPGQLDNCERIGSIKQQDSPRTSVTATCGRKGHQTETQCRSCCMCLLQATSYQVRRSTTDLPTMRQEIRGLCVRCRGQHDTIQRAQAQERGACKGEHTASTLYDFLQNRPLIEAEEIFRRIRSTQDPLEVLRHVTTADLLMAQTTASEKHTQSQDPQGTSSNRNYAPGSGSLKYDPVHDSQ
ncbi:hypothetical protein KCU64_g5771, partial [Aureobasidium melanogenum]